MTDGLGWEFSGGCGTGGGGGRTVAMLRCSTLAGSAQKVSLS